MSSRKPDGGCEEWIALPGLFDPTEIVTGDGLEVRAHPLVVMNGRVFYGVYVRESRAAMARRPAA